MGDSCSFISPTVKKKKKKVPGNRCNFKPKNKEKWRWQLRMKCIQRPYQSHSLRYICDSDYLKTIRYVHWLFRSGAFRPHPTPLLGARAADAHGVVCPLACWEASCSVVLQEALQLTLQPAADTVSSTMAPHPQRLAGELLTQHRL